MAAEKIVLGWLLTYAVHSTLLLGAALLGERLLRRRSLLLRDGLLKLALCGGVITASAQLFAGHAPLAGRLPIGAAIEEAPAPRATLRLRSSVHLPAVEARASARLPLPAAPPAPLVARALLLGWLAGAALLLLRAGAALVALRRQLRDRRSVDHEPIGEQLAQLLPAGAAAPRLSASETLRTPIAFGLRRPEICLPERVLSDLPRAQQRGVLAHELSHVLRRDPAWLLIGGLIERVLFFQPLNRLARRRLHEIGEFICDDWSVEQTGQPLALARCLTEVAGWIVAERAALPAVAMARSGSDLGRRVRRLLDAGPRRLGPAPRWLAPLWPAVLGLMVACAPAFGDAARRDEDEDERTCEDGRAAPPAPPAPPAPVARPAPPAPPAAPAPPAPPGKRGRHGHHIDVKVEIDEAQIEREVQEAAAEAARESAREIEEAAREAAQEAAEAAREAAQEAADEADDPDDEDEADLPARGERGRAVAAARQHARELAAAAREHAREQLRAARDQMREQLREAREQARAARERSEADRAARGPRPEVEGPRQRAFEQLERQREQLERQREQLERQREQLERRQGQLEEARRRLDEAHGAVEGARRPAAPRVAPVPPSRATPPTAPTAPLPERKGTDGK